VSAGLASLTRSLAINGLGSWLVYVVFERAFPSPSLVPLWAAATIPIADLAWELWRRRSVDVIALIALTQLSAGILINLFARTPRAALVGHAWQAAGLGLVFAASIAVGHPLMAPLARQALCGDDMNRRAKFDEALVKLPQVRRQLAYVSLVWTLALCVETGVCLAILARAPVSLYLLVANVLGWAVTIVLALGSIRYGHWMARRLVAQGLVAAEPPAS
jgi:hypothetical protein